jgi:hypothetical protein
MGFSFNRQRSCPACGKAFSEAEQKAEFDPVIVVVCPGCQKLLWRPGSDEDSELVIYDPDADAGGI